MPESSRRNRVITVVLVVIVLLLLLLLVRCQRRQTAVPEIPPSVAPNAKSTAPAPGGKLPDEILTAATLDLPAQVGAGAAFPVKWTGPNNPKDYLTIVRKDAAEGAYENYRETSEGNPVQLLAPIDAGEWEVRYVAIRSKRVLGRAPLLVTSNQVTLQAPREVVAGAAVAVRWTGPNNAGDYLTIVTKATPDGQYGNYANTAQGASLTITAPIADGEAELRYMTGQGAKVLQRLALKVVAVQVELDAPATAAAGSKVAVTWTGPNNNGDYITIVPQSLPDGQYAGYANTAWGSPAKVDAPKGAMLAEIRYVSGQGGKVLKRRPIAITP